MIEDIMHEYDFLTRHNWNEKPFKLHCVLNARRSWIIIFHNLVGSHYHADQVSDYY
jgi:hypothetical protein